MKTFFSGYKGKGGFLDALSNSKFDPEKKNYDLIKLKCESLLQEGKEVICNIAENFSIEPKQTIYTDNPFSLESVETSLNNCTGTAVETRATIGMKSIFELSHITL